MVTSGGRRRFPSELAVACALLLNSLSITLFIKADFGLSVISGVPYVVSLILPQLSLGVWTTVLQCFWMLVMALVLRRVRVGYLLSFALGILFGFLLDFWAAVLAPLPGAFGLRILYFAIGHALMACGIALFFRCRLPALPFDTVPREIGAAYGLTVKRARTGFDLINLAIMLALGLLFLGYPAGIGPGTILNALLLGTGAGRVADFLDRRFEIAPCLPGFSRLE